MPSMSGHMAIAKKVSDILRIDDDSFIVGNLLPDLYSDKTKSHFKYQSKKFLVPDIGLAKSHLNLSNKKDLGYLCHLLLDYYYLEEFLKDTETDIFEDTRIYKDYDILSKDIVEYFKLEVNHIIELLKKMDEEIENDKLEYNIECLQKSEEGYTYYLEKDSFINFLEVTAIRIAEEVKPYAS